MTACQIMQHFTDLCNVVHTAIPLPAHIRCAGMSPHLLLVWLVEFYSVLVVHAVMHLFFVEFSGMQIWLLYRLGPSSL